MDINDIRRFFGDASVTKIILVSNSTTATVDFTRAVNGDIDVYQHEEIADGLSDYYLIGEVDYDRGNVIEEILLRKDSGQIFAYIIDRTKSPVLVASSLAEMVTGYMAVKHALESGYNVGLDNGTQGDYWEQLLYGIRE